MTTTPDSLYPRLEPLLAQVSKPVQQGGSSRLIFVDDARPLSAEALAQIQGAEEMVFSYQGGEWRIPTAPDALRADTSRSRTAAR